MDEPEGGSGNEGVEALDLEPPTTVRTRRPRVLWAALAVVAVAVGAVVVTSTDDDRNQRAGLPVDLAGAVGGGVAEAAADSMLARVVYVPGDDLPALGGEATAYRLTGDVDESRVRTLAEALGLDGDVQSDASGAWWVDGGGAGRLDVHAGLMWSFFAGESDCVTDEGGIACCAPDVRCETFSSTGVAIEDEDSACGDDPECAVPTTSTADSCVESDGVAVDRCARPVPGPPEGPTSSAACTALEGDEVPEDCNDNVDVGVGGTGSDCADGDDCLDTGDPLPPLEGEDDAKRIALAVVAATGVDVDGARVTANDGSESRSWAVTVEPVLVGRPSGLQYYVEVSESGVVVSGGGYLGRPEAVGDFPLLDTHETIERANAQSNTGIEPALGDPEAMSGTTGGTDDLETSTTVHRSAAAGAGADPCAPPEGASDGCGTGADPGTTPPCQVQADGSEICQYPGECVAPSGDADTTTTLSCELRECPSNAPVEDLMVGVPEDAPATADPCAIEPCADPTANPVDCDGMECPTVAPDTTVSSEVAQDPVAVPADDEPVAAPKCTPPIDPLPAPEPLEIVLVDAEPSLVLLPANDGSADVYLVPAYRFTDADGGQVDLPAVADEALTGPGPTDTTVPDTVVPAPVPEPEICESFEEVDPSGTTHTVLTCPTPEVSELIIGEGYYVDIDVECAGGSFELGGKIWVTEDSDVQGWADLGERHEGGTFTLDSADHGTFVGDANGDLTAEFNALDPAEDIFCTPQPR